MREAATMSIGVRRVHTFLPMRPYSRVYEWKGLLLIIFKLESLLKFRKLTARTGLFKHHLVKSYSCPFGSPREVLPFSSL